MRNIDFIRKLKPKKLALFMAFQICDGCECCIYKTNDPCPNEITDADCEKGTKKWLKQQYDKNDKVWRDIFDS